MNFHEIEKAKMEARVLKEKRKDISFYQISDDWLRGFIEAEGCFTQNSKTNRPIFEISQLSSDNVLFLAIKSKMNCGSLGFHKKKDKSITIVYSLTRKKDIIKYLLPLLFKNFVLSKARNPYNSWLKRHFPDYWDKFPNKLERLAI